MSLQTALASMVLCTGLFAAGGPPMMTDGTGTPGDGHWELNLGFKSGHVIGSTRYEAPIIDLNYGLGERIQLKVESAYITLDEEMSKKHGIGNAKAGVKWRFYEDDTDLSFSTYPQYTFAPVHKNIDKALADVEESWFFPLEMSKRFDTITITAEVGYLAVTHEDDWIKSGLVVGYSPNKSLELLAEVYRNVQTNGEEESIFLNAGFTYTLTPQINGLFSIGKEVKSPSSPKSELLFVGLQLLF